jgi:glutathione S-transferase
MNPSPEDDMTELKIYGFAPSTYTQTALMVAAEAGAAPTLAPLEFKKPSHFALHPYGKMPVLEHGEVKLFETLAIASYVDQVLGGGRLQPHDPAGRARMLQWISVAVDYAYEDLVNKLHEDEPSAEAVTAAGEQLGLLDRALGAHPYFGGDALTLADLFLYPMVEFAVGKLGEASVRKLPRLARWRDALAARPGARKAV